MLPDAQASHIRHAVTASDRSSMKSRVSGGRKLERSTGKDVGMNGIMEKLGRIVQKSSQALNTDLDDGRRKGNLVTLAKQLKSKIGSKVSMQHVGNLFIGKDTYERIMKKAIHKAATRLAATNSS